MLQTNNFSSTQTSLRLLRKLNILYFPVKYDKGKYPEMHESSQFQLLI